MSTSPISETVADAAFECDVSWRCRGACAGEQFYRAHEGKRYCVLHFPGKGKGPKFEAALQQKIERNDFDFRGIFFPDEVQFCNLEFTRADFSFATFAARADFSSARFTGRTNFIETSFYGEVIFIRASFDDQALFLAANFALVGNFQSTSFTAVADFRHASCSLMMFSSATFKDQVRFAANSLHPKSLHPSFTDNTTLDLQFARIEKPERISFHTLPLRPYWFVNVDARKFEFTNVEWRWGTIFEEIINLAGKGVTSELRMLAIACRNLAVNAEENHRYEEASKFRYMAMDARRLEHWRGFDFRRLSWWYWLASGYGERILRAAIVLLGILLVSTVLYTQVGFARWEPRLASESDAATAKRDEVGAPLKLSRALTYSAAVMTFQRPEPRPATTAAQTIVLLETILGPVQAALLALAIRRKFMR